VIKSIKIKWTGHVALMREARIVYRVLVGKPEGNRPRRRWEIILRCIFRKCDDRVWAGLSWLRIEKACGHL
jgi:hypothetical protein